MKKTFFTFALKYEESFSLTILINVSCLWLWWALETLTIINQS